jgi:hypothetical protein
MRCKDEEMFLVSYDRFGNEKKKKEKEKEKEIKKSKEENR